MRKLGIAARDPRQTIATLSGGERQCIAISRARAIGGLILDEPTSALGVTQAVPHEACSF